MYRLSLTCGSDVWGAFLRRISDLFVICLSKYLHPFLISWNGHLQNQLTVAFMPYIASYIHMNVWGLCICRMICMQDMVRPTNRNTIKWRDLFRGLQINCMHWTLVVLVRGKYVYENSWENLQQLFQAWWVLGSCLDYTPWRHVNTNSAAL